MSYYERHVFFCCNQRDGERESCNPKGASDLRDYAKKRVKELGLAGEGKVRIVKGPTPMPQGYMQAPMQMQPMPMQQAPAPAPAAAAAKTGSGAARSSAGAAHSASAWWRERKGAGRG